MPEGALGKHHPVGEDGLPVVGSISITVPKTEDTVRFLFELFLDLFVAARRVADIEMTLFVKSGCDRAAAETGDAGRLDGESLRQGKLMRAEALLAGGFMCRQQETGDEECFAESVHSDYESRNSSVSKAANEPTSPGYRIKPFSCLHPAGARVEMTS